MKFLRLRSDNHAQYEIRAYANTMIDTLKKWVPITYEAFMDYRVGGTEVSLKGKEAIKKLERKEKLQYNGWAEDLNDETYKYKGLTWGKTPEAITYFESADWEAGVPFYDLNYISDGVFDEHHKYPNHKRKLKQEEINPDGWGECSLIRKFA